MKKIITLAIFFSVFMACVPAPIPSPTAGPFTRVPSQTRTPLPFPTFTITPLPTASGTPTPFNGQVSMEHAQIVYYDITGSNASELRKSMNKYRPKDPYDRNRPVDSYTDWYISWNWPGYGSEDCDLSAAVIEYEIKVIVPRWKPPADASTKIITKWETYVQSLAFHEKGHIDNIVNNYLGVKAAIQSATCSTAEAEAQKALLPLHKFDADYDRETKHGETQGAVFP